MTGGLIHTPDNSCHDECEPQMPKQLTALSLGAGVQSTALLLLAIEGRIARPDVAVFADTGWEPASVYEHLDRLDREVAQPAGIEIKRVRATQGTGQGIRADTLSPDTRFWRVPFFMRLADEDGASPARPTMLRRACTTTYKIDPVYREYRRRLGAPVYANGRVGPPPAGAHMTIQVGISTDEFQRARTAREPWATNSYPLLELGWSRGKCINYLESVGWGSTRKSSCIGCPFHGNDEWRRLQDEEPEAFADAVEFDEAIRNGPPRERTNGTRWAGKYFLHSSGVPLSQVTFRRRKSDQLSLLDMLDEGDGWSCSPHGCKTEDAEFQALLRAAGGIEMDDADDDCTVCGAAADVDCECDGRSL